MKLNSIMVYVALIMALVALFFSVAAYNRTGKDLDTRITNSITEQQTQLRQHIAAAELQLRLLALRASIQAEESQDILITDIENIRRDVVELYQLSEHMTQQQFEQIDSRLETLANEVRMESGAALAVLNTALADVRSLLDISSREACRQAGGEWREFPDACADRCGQADVCAKVLTPSCDCGPQRCWNGVTCKPA